MGVEWGGGGRRDARGLRMYEGWNGVGVRGCVGTCGFELRGEGRWEGRRRGYFRYYVSR